MLNLLVGQPIEEPIDFGQLFNDNQSIVIYVVCVACLTIITIIIYKSFI